MSESEYGWLIYCFDDEELILECIYKTEDDARKFIKNCPYYKMSNDINVADCIKFKIKKIPLK